MDGYSLKFRRLKFYPIFWNSANLKFWFDFGTLLGIVREGKLLPGAGDIGIVEPKKINQCFDQ